jgi:hypothetical protein
VTHSPNITENLATSGLNAIQATAAKTSKTDYDFSNTPVLYFTQLGLVQLRCVAKIVDFNA